MFLSILLTYQVLGHDMYCPDQSSYDFYEGAQWTGNGWQITGEGRVYGRTSFNMLGGYVEFDMDTSNAQAQINTNFYTISPEASNYNQYCDIQACNDWSCPQCMEMDIVENNGDCYSATTIHTMAGTNTGGCDQWGCQAGMWSSGTRHFKAEFSTSGRMTVTIGGQANTGYSPYPDGNSDNTVVSTMQRLGAKLISTQWGPGYVPNQDGCPQWGNLDASSFSVKNVRVYGTIVLGDTTVPRCGGPGPTPSPGPTPKPGPGNKCPADVCSWEQCGSTVPWVCYDGQAVKGCAPDESIWANSAACNAWCDTRQCFVARLISLEVDM